MKKQIIALFLAATMVVSVSGCGTGSSEPSAPTSLSEAQPLEEISEPVPVVKNNDPIKINDFYEYAAGEWMNSTEVGESNAYAFYDDETDRELENRVYDFVKGKSSEDFSDNPGLQKLLVLSEQLRDEELVNKGIDRMKNMYNTVDSAKNLDDFLKLMADPLYCGGSLFYRDYEYTSDGDYLLIFRSLPYASTYNLTEEEENFLQKEFTKQFILIGESEEKAAEKAALAVSLNHEILKMYTNTGDLNYWDEDNYPSSGHKAPYIDIMKSLDYHKVDIFGNNYYAFFALDEDLNMLDTLLSNENLPALKALWEVNFFEGFYDCGSFEMKESCARLAMGLSGYDLEKIDDKVFLDSEEELINLSYSIPVSIDYGHFAKLYRDAYLTSEDVSEIEEMTRLAKEKYIDIINEYDWISPRLKEKLILKIKKISVDLGEYSEYPSYEDVIIGEDPVETLRSFQASNRAFNKRYLEAEEGLPSNDMNLFRSNGLFTSDSNTVFLTLGTIYSFTENRDASYEAKLGIFGSTLTHEIAHALAPGHIQNGVNGLYMDFLSDEEVEIIRNRYDDFASVIDGLETEHGNKINGYSCCNEFFTDVLSVNCMLRMLEDMDDPDYDSFFVNFALSIAAKTTPCSEDCLFRNGSHLFGRARVNAALYQFDKLYEVYDIDETDAFYIKPENRVIGY